MGRSKAPKEPKKEEEVIPVEIKPPTPPVSEEELPPKPPSPVIVEEEPYHTHLAKIVIENVEEEKEDFLFTGHRTVTYKDCNSYSGDFVDGLMHGSGEYTWSDTGLKYKGDFTNNTITGEGVYRWPDGSVYEGEVKNGLRHGKGTFFCVDNVTVYQGEWSNGKRNGEGRITYDKEGLDYYVGGWVDNKKCGKGFRRYPSGSTYDGEWYDNVRHGEGKMVWTGTGESYSGRWVMGIQHGKGTHVWMMSTHSHHPVRNEYRGDFVRGKRHGMGSFIYASGARYEGEWVENKKHGYGRFFFKDGSIFDGNFINDSIANRPGSPDVGKMMRSAVLTGRISSPLQETMSKNALKNCQSKLVINIGDLVDDDIYYDDELQQTQNVILRHISLLRQIYDSYCKLADPQSGSLYRMELWKLLKDSLIYLKLPMPAADIVISTAMKIEEEEELESPFTEFLFRDFIYILVHLAVKIYQKTIEKIDGVFISRCLSSLILDHLEPLRPDSIYRGNSHSTTINKNYMEKSWEIYQHFKAKYPNPTLRKILFFLKDLRLLGPNFPRIPIGPLINDIIFVSNANIFKDDALFLDVATNFYEFFDILCGCPVILKHANMETCASTDPARSAMSVIESQMPTLGDLTLEADPIAVVPSSPSGDQDVKPSDPKGQENVTAKDSLISERNSVVSPVHSVFVDERCGSFEDPDNRIEEFFVCHFFPAANHLYDIDTRITVESEERERKTQIDMARLEVASEDEMLDSKMSRENVPFIDIERVSSQKVAASV